MNALPTVASPCTKVCTLDAEGRYCVGCWRTIDEIACWGRLSPAQRAGVVAELPARRLRLGSPPPALTPSRCPSCGAGFGCGANDPHNACWCTRFPPVAPRAGLSCLCPVCLAAAST